MSIWSTAGGDYGMTSMESGPGEHQPRTYVTEIWCPPARPAGNGVHALHSRMPEPEPLPEPEPEAEP